jgi:hypothetical protein
MHFQRPESDKDRIRKLKDKLRKREARRVAKLKRGPGRPSPPS